MGKKILATGLALLFLLASIVPLSTGLNVKKSEVNEKSPYRGDTFYVGGNGPNNNSKIQDGNK